MFKLGSNSRSSNRKRGDYRSTGFGGLTDLLQQQGCHNVKARFVLRNVGIGEGRVKKQQLTKQAGRGAGRL